MMRLSQWAFLALLCWSAVAVAAPSGQLKLSPVIKRTAATQAYEYDGFDRLFRVRHPGLANGAVPSATDYSEYLYDKAGNIVSERRRDGQVLQFAYDNVGSLRLKDVPEASRDVTYAYDLAGRLTSATLPTPNASLSVTFTYDRIGRVLSSVSGQSLAYSYEPAGAWTTMVYPGGLSVTTCFDAAGRVSRIKEAAIAALQRVIDPPALHRFDGGHADGLAILRHLHRLERNSLLLWGEFPVLKMPFRPAESDGALASRWKNVRIVGRSAN
jgi:YD repeat-containing protein